MRTAIGGRTEVAARPSESLPPWRMRSAAAAQAAALPVLDMMSTRIRSVAVRLTPLPSRIPRFRQKSPVTTVAKVVLGDILRVGYTIDPRLQGTISLASGRPVPKADLLFVLENALRIGNVALVRETAGYRIVPLSDAIGSGNVDNGPGQAEPGYGISVVPLQYVSAQTLIKLIDSFAARPGTVRANATRNMLLIQGSGAERRTAIETVLSFDVDWMQGQSVGIFPVRNSTPDPIVAELEK